tara:strand:- start:61 stop:525 length:465 start_codon:yes stop_codon:yes gene_type:complete
MRKLPKQVKPIETILHDGNDILHLLVTQSQELKRIEEIIASYMPFEFGISGIKRGIIKIIVSKATEATSAMYREEVILSALSNAGIAANEIKMVVRPRQNKPSLFAPGKKVSINAADTVAMNASEIGDTAISQALGKLSETLRRRIHEDAAKPS